MYCTYNQFSKVINSLSNSIKKDVNYYILENSFLENHLLIYDILYDKYSKPVFFLCNIKDQQRANIKHFYINGFFGSYFSHQDILQLELRLNIQQGSTYLEIIKIHSGSQKRLGRGTLALQFL